MTKAPTTRETADHAELVRLAEAASARLAGPNLNADGFGLQIWGDSLKGGSTHVLDVRGWGYLTGGGHGALGLSEDDGIAAQRAIQAYAVAAWNAVPALLSEIEALRGERDRLRNAASKSNEEVCQSLGKALGYPWFKDDQANFPGSTEEHGVCVGDHVAESIADEAARRLTQAERQRDEARDTIASTVAKADWMQGHLSGERSSIDRETIELVVSECRAYCHLQALANQGADPAPVKKERAWICPQDNTPCPPECDSDDRRHCASVACKEQPA